MTVFYYQLLVRPQPESDNWGKCGGAYACCWVKNSSFDRAHEQIMHAMSKLGWIVEGIEEKKVIEETSYASNSPAYSHYQKANKEGSYFLLHTWPNEAEDEETQ